MMNTATAQAHPNIALVKYWGKRDPALNLPSVPSLSITLDSLTSRTQIEFVPGLAQDEFLLNDETNESMTERVSHCLDWFRNLAGCELRAGVTSKNNFPTAAGLASSAAGFAALVVAANEALGLSLDRTELSRFARRASGSAGRSLFSGFAEQNMGTRPDGSDCQVTSVVEADFWPLEVVIAITSEHAKKTGSSEGMLRSSATSPCFPGWVDTAAGDLDAARQAVLGRDFDKLATVSESSCLKMHAVMLSSQPALIYWNGATVDCIERVRELRNAGQGVFFTIDAGPQLKAVCLPGHGETVAASLAEIPGVKRVIQCALGPGASLVSVT